ncbi:MAG: hypothetical protein L7F77_06520 [Candidatus Magnetominusculus sp. LBB02]|nr:hypothetical protein [Candidatus Magnetominusculus sp. LBB02]
MSKELAAIVYPGLHYKESISYASKMAAETGAALSVIGVIPEFCASERAAISMCELGPMASLSEGIERDSRMFFDMVKAYCKDADIKTEFSVYRGSLEDVIDHVRQTNQNMELLVVPTPSKTLTKVVSTGKKSLRASAELKECAVVLVLD